MFGPLTGRLVSSHSASSALPKVAHLAHFIRCPAPIERVGLLTHLKFENRLSRFNPKGLNHSLYRIKLHEVPAILGNFGRNQLLDGSISLSPPIPKFDDRLHVRIAADLHQSFSGFVPTRA